jgi:WhiB family transcriptional regulator, redox-sensing transcriptional regulator
MTRPKQAPEQNKHPQGTAAEVAYSWQSEASCRGVDAELFFPATEDEAMPAKAICEQCPVRVACLAFALERNEKFGVWGGLTEKERARLSPAARESIKRQAAAA